MKCKRLRVKKHFNGTKQWQSTKSIYIDPMWSNIPVKLPEQEQQKRNKICVEWAKKAENANNKMKKHDETRDENSELDGRCLSSESKQKQEGR